MIASHPRDPVIALDGSGPRLVRCAARRLVLENREITILATSADPVATYQQYAQNRGGTVLRSEFEAHFLAPVRRPPGSDRPDAVLSPTPGAARTG